MPTVLDAAPGSVVLVRDEEWLVTGVEQTTDGSLLRVQGLSELVRDTTASFYSGIDEIVPLDPADAEVVADSSRFYRRSRLWLESTLRKTALQLDAPPAVSQHMLADALDYQMAAVRQALDPANLRTRILLADAVGLGKTLEIGMILSELVRRGRGERILIVCPRHVLEQMQGEMWNRFALPFVRLDSVGIQRVRQKLPATRNPFTYYKRAIISIDTLKSDRYRNALRHHQWDAVVIDESHNLTNSATQNNQLARVLAPNTDALILASATPHNGKPESFAELIRLLEPTAVAPDGNLNTDEVKRLIVRRHRNSPEVAREVGAAWAERKEPQNWLVPASAAENAIADELDQVWLHPQSGSSPYSGRNDRLFPWTLAKAFLSSPAAFIETVDARRKRLDVHEAAAVREREALDRLHALGERAQREPSGKVTRLVDYLRTIGVGRGAAMRAVVFAERVPTLKWLQATLPKHLGLPPDAVEVLHGGLSDEVQQAVVESFKQAGSPIRVLVTGDIASEGVNLHTQCHELIHFDIPWSLIRLEQRNGRIDRYGQRTPPQITTLLLDPTTERFRGDLRVLSRLVEKEQEAHTALGDVASLMGKYSVDAEEDEIRRVLAGEADLDAVVATPDDVAEHDPIAAILASIAALPPTPQPTTNETKASPADTGLYPTRVDFLREALHEAYKTPDADLARGGVRWREHPHENIVDFAPPPDLRQRLDVLPQTYLAQRRVNTDFKLATSTHRGKALLTEALNSSDAERGMTWPEAHYLGPLHPVLDWAADRALASLARNEVFAVRGTVENPTVLVLGTLTNQRGQVVATAYVSAEFPDPEFTAFCTITPHPSASAMLGAAGIAAARSNPGPVADAASLRPLLRTAVTKAEAQMALMFTAAEQAAHQRVRDWSDRVNAWSDQADTLAQGRLLKQRRVGVQEEQQRAAAMNPARQLVRPLVVVLPASHPTAPSARAEADHGNE